MEKCTQRVQNDNSAAPAEQETRGISSDLMIRWINLKIQDLDYERLRWIYFFLCGYLSPKKTRNTKENAPK